MSNGSGTRQKAIPVLIPIQGVVRQGGVWQRTTTHLMLRLRGQSIWTLPASSAVYALACASASYATLLSFRSTPRTIEQTY